MDGFKYVIGEKEGVVIVLFQGRMGGKEVSALDTLTEELKVKPQLNIIFDFRNVSNILPAAYGAIAQLLKLCRDGKKSVALSSFKPDLKKMLLQAGVVREAELFNNIPDAWKKLSSTS